MSAGVRPDNRAGMRYAPTVRATNAASVEKMCSCSGISPRARAEGRQLDARHLQFEPLIALRFRHAHGDLCRMLGRVVVVTRPAGDELLEHRFWRSGTDGCGHQRQAAARKWLTHPCERAG